MPFAVLATSEIAARKQCGQASHDKKSPLLGSGGVAHRDPFCPGMLSGVDATVADVFQSAVPETECGPIFVSSYGDMIAYQAGVFAKASEIRRLSEAFCKYAQQAGPAGLGAVTHARATVEVVCHADL